MDIQFPNPDEEERFQWMFDQARKYHQDALEEHFLEELDKLRGDWPEVQIDHNIKQLTVGEILLRVLEIELTRINDERLGRKVVVRNGLGEIVGAQG